MAHPATTEEDVDLIKSLTSISQRHRKLIKSSTYTTPADERITVRSWKMDEFKYYQVPSPFPTLARGIFTVDNVPGEGKVDRIIIRGYDKFFNIGEVPWTTWEALETHTVAPYTMSLKSNGCIIFIGALTPEKLLITSKHAVGSGAGGNISHAEAGERWLRTYFSQKGKTEANMSKVLWDNNWTAIAELCDDSFEEHVLPYSPELTGLHLHGLNESTKLFKTLPASTVDAFAQEWGFIQTQSITLNSIEEVRQFRDEVERTKMWNGEAVEGFVVRTHIGPPPRDATKNFSPYDVGDTFFFKIKFDEPYMMYRDWREVTKTLLSKYDKDPRSMNERAVSRKKMEREETKVYVKWVIEDIRTNRKAYDGYQHGHGIIATRERFQRWLAQEEGGVQQAQIEETSRASGSRTFGQTVIVPIAIPGSGKTALSVALTHLFPSFGHIQSDDVKAKKRSADVFLNNVLTCLKTHDVVIADKNNHLTQHRTSLRTTLSGFTPPVRFVVLDWSHLFATDETKGEAYEIACSRVTDRGDNHQSLVASMKHHDIIQRFIKELDPLTEGEMDEVIEMQMQGEGDLEANLRKTVAELLRIIPGLAEPEEERIREAIERAMTHKVAAKGNGDGQGNGKGKEKEKEVATGGGKKKKIQVPRYFGLVSSDLYLTKVVNRIFELDHDSDGKAFWGHLKEAGRVTPQPHVTVVHSKAIAAAASSGDAEGEGEQETLQALWDRCVSLTSDTASTTFTLKLGHLIWNTRVMALTVDSLTPTAESEEQNGVDFINQLPPSLRNRLHVTVGTRTKHILPVEAKGIVERWRAGEDVEDLKVLELRDPVEINVVLKGLIS
ncbi:RNA ligase-domain-containing protein [Flagelloscypha sp. PMI_526]|nr:RNA ligase-domain-containing protein [Flagelloscypha sp. PMI_526]